MGQLRQAVRHFLARFGDRQRVTGDPTSTNGASSFHLRWFLPAGEYTAVEATLEVIERPAVPRLHFWALQASFAKGRQHGGAGHLGLMWHPGHPGSTAVNWGGYAAAGGVLNGSESALPSARGNANTRDFDWQPNRAYRLRIAWGGDDRWTGSVADISTGEVTTVRDLYAPGSRLVGPLMWSEVFARCDHPPTAVRWSDLSATTITGESVVVEAVTTNYQARNQGGCDKHELFSRWCRLGAAD